MQLTLLAYLSKYIEKQLKPSFLLIYSRQTSFEVNNKVNGTRKVCFVPFITYGRDYKKKL